MKKIVVSLAVLFFIIPTSGYSEEFSFYDVKFGTTKGEISSSFKTDKRLGSETEEAVVLNFGHGVEQMQLFFDHKHHVYSMKVYYPKYALPEKREALRLALEERFKKPLGNAETNVKIDFSEHEDRLIMIATSIPMRDAFIDVLKGQMLKKIQ